jgi:hypothetical protein
VSPSLRRPAGHDRARELAAARVDEPLAPDDAAWLEDHLATCVACRAVADGYEADRRLFAPLKTQSPVPPRDLWARTAAAIDAEAHATRRDAPAPSRGLRPASLVPVAGLAAVAVVAGTVLLSGGGVLTSPSGAPDATAMALQPGQVAVITRGPDGGVAFVTVPEVCPIAAETCDVAAPSFDAAPQAVFAKGTNVDAILSPDKDRVVLVQRDAKGTDGGFVVPVRTAAGQVPDPTPGSTAAAATDAPTEAPTEATEPPTPTDEPTPDASDAPESNEPSASTGTEPTEAPTDEPETPSPEPTEEPTPDATPSVEVTSGEDGAIEIASDVVVVGSIAAYNDDGTRFAFTARPADGSTGPDVYVWDTGDARARAVTSDHGSILAGWDGNDLLVSRVVDGSPWTVVVEPKHGEIREELGAAWLPTVSPDGASAAWWEGSVKLADDGVTWVPDKGRLVVGPWPGGIGAKDGLQVLDRGQVGDWEVQWDPSGRALAAWTTGPGAGRLGTLGLYELEAGTGRAGVDTPKFQDTDAFGGFSLDRSQLVYAAPDDNGERALWVVAWDGDDVGRVRLPGDATVIR